MKFGKTLDNLMVPEWRHQYMNYNELKQMIRNAVEKAPSGSRPSNNVAIGYYRDFESLFFNSCGVELTKVNYFFAHKQAEAHRKLATLNYQLDRRRAQQDPRGSTASRGSASSWSRQTENKRKLPPIKKLRLAMSEFYLSLIMLQNYQTLNMTAFRKICKKYDKNLKSEAGFAWYDKYVLRSTLAITLQLDRMISTTENMYTDYLANGDRSEAMAKLRVPPLGHPTPPVHVFSAGLFLGLFLVGAIICFISYFSVDTSPEFRYTFVSLFRGPISGVTFGFCLAINIKVYEKVGVNHVLIFEVERRNAIGAMRALEISSFFGYMCTLSILLYLLHKEFFIEDPIYIPLVQVAFVVVLFLNPFRILFYSGRIWLLTVMGRILLSPFFFVNFADFWVADQWTSLVVTIVDHYYLVRFYVRYFLDRSDAFEFEPDYAVAVIRCLPAWFRFAQSLRRFRDSGSKSTDYLINALKYFLFIAEVVFSTIQMETIAHYTDLFESPWTWAYITICIVSSIYTVFWDLLMDFGLFRVWNGENKFLRDNLVYPRWFYYFVIVENTLLRCVWILEFALVHQELIAPYNGQSLIGFSEIVRRFFWNFLRLENEHLYNCGQFRATRDIFITRLDPQEERFLESVMDNTEDLGREKLNKKYF
ncbi:xenotropic and polytropic retrovirus receptor 1 homolog isoform X2 [Drosophila sechellia]|uniref:GM16982 n=2 Tax=Drosophila sechellia TaxID=7238 RepID=B4I607_DROSE|nr:xenotropic and polytropic retrovirus receptor 1 homolog isoform X2 [Drosophila sechellia]EDW55813.1 GM16982 [Drosophila sechellia]